MTGSFSLRMCILFKTVVINLAVEFPGVTDFTSTVLKTGVMSVIVQASDCLGSFEWERLREMGPLLINIIEFLH